MRAAADLHSAILNAFCSFFPRRLKETNVDPGADRASSITQAERQKERGTTDKYSYILWTECLLLKANLSPHCSPEREGRRAAGAAAAKEDGRQSKRPVNDLCLSVLPRPPRWRPPPHFRRSNPIRARCTRFPQHKARTRNKRSSEMRRFGDPCFGHGLQHRSTSTLLACVRVLP